MNMSVTVVRVCRGWTLLGLAMICWFALYCSSPLLGQDSLSEMYHKSWTAKDGAPSNWDGMAADRDGFLWITTDNGLYRFDGISFERYHPPVGEALLSERLNEIMVARDGSIWFSYMYGGVTRIKNGHITNFSEHEGMHQSHSGDIAEDLDGNVWVAGYPGVEVISDSHVTRLAEETGLENVIAEVLRVDHEGNIWLPTESRLLLLPRGARSVQVATLEPYGNCAVARDSGVWCSFKTKPLMHFVYAQGRISSQVGWNTQASVQKVFFAKDGSTWAGTQDRGVLRIAGDPASTGRPEGISRREGLTGNFVGEIIEDREGSVWVATDRGLDQFRKIPLHVIPLDGTFPTLPTGKPNSRLLVATHHLVDITSGSAVYLPDDIGPSPRYLFRSDEGTLWIGGAFGIWLYRDGQITKQALPPDLKETKPIVLAIVEDSKHEIWASISGNGLYRLGPEGWVKKGGYDALPNASPWAALRDHLGNLWFGFRNNKIAEIADGHVTIFDSSKGLNLREVKVLCEKDGKIWAGGEDGLAVVDRGVIKTVTLAGPGALSSVAGLVFTPNGDLWLNSDSGLLQIGAEEITQVESDPNHALRFRKFDYLDGLEGIPPTVTGIPSATLGLDGRLYLISDTFLQWIDPVHLPINDKPPHIVVVAVKVGNEVVYRPTNSIKLNPSLSNLEIDYTASSLLIPERVKFRYRLDGFDKSWNDVGTRRQAFYSRLPAGTYSFRVIACNDSGLWSPSGTVITLVVPPTWFETIWFRLGACVGLATLLYLGFRFRMRHIKRNLTERLNERFAERERIARDLHDTLFQGVEGGLLHINAVTSRLPMEPVAKDRLRGAFHEINQVMAASRNLIFDRHEPTELLDFEGTVASYGEQVGLLSESRFSVVSSGRKREIKPAVSEELLKIIKESLSNAFRHANANEIQVKIIYTPSVLEVFVSDDGIGIDPIILEEGGRQGHWGMSSMRQRAAEVEGKLKVSQREGGGTEVRITIPASQAFRFRGREFLAKILGRNRNMRDTAA